MATDTREIDPIRGYLDAVQAYEQERTKAKTLIDRISTVANAMQNHLPDFLGLNYSLAASMTAGDRSRADRSLHFNMDDWPNAQTICSTMTDWHAAFMKLHDAWRLVPEQYRQGLREPPKGLSTS